MGRVVHFEIHASDPERAVRFCRELFGWAFTRWEGPMDYWLVQTGDAAQPGIYGGLLRRQGAAPASGQAVNAYVCTVGVADLDDAVARSTRLGATLAVPTMAIPGPGWLAYVTDPEGSFLGIRQPDPTAA